jgi:hypothetical protein
MITVRNAQNAAAVAQISPAQPMSRRGSIGKNRRLASFPFPQRSQSRIPQRSLGAVAEYVLIYVHVKMTIRHLDATRLSN